MHISSDGTAAPLPIFTPAPAARTSTSLAERQSTASTAQVVREPSGRYVALVDGGIVTGSSVQAVENNVTNLVNIFA